MQISLNQAEIEQAIDDFINKQISINDTQEVTIDLKATRGPEGFQAFIEVVDKSQNKRSTDKDKDSVASKQKQEVADPKAKEEDAAPKKDISTQPVVTEQPKLNVVGEPVEAAKDTTTNDYEADVVFEEKSKPAETETPVSDKPVNSLFGGLRKPQND